MGRLAQIAIEFSKFAPGYFEHMRELIRNKDAAENSQPEEPAEMPIAEAKKPELVKEDYQLRNIKRLIKKTDKK